MRALLIACVLLAAAMPALAAAGDRRPYLDALDRPRAYAGPGREDPDPEGLTEVRIGWFGPADPAHPVGGDPWLAAGLAIDQANAGGGYKGLPFRLLTAWSENPWGTGVSRVARMAWGEGIWALVGSIDGASTHLAEQVVAKARLTLVSPGGTDRSVSMANVAWAFSCLPPDDRLARAIAARAAAGARPRALAIVSGTDHDSRLTAQEYRRALAQAGAPAAHDLAIDAVRPGIAGLIDRIGAIRPDTIAIVAGAADSALVLRAVRHRLADVEILGGPSMSHRAFLDRAGPAAEGVIFPLPCDPDYAGGTFGQAFRSAFGREPDCPAAQAYDAVNLVVEAVRAAGLNRARIRDAVESASPRPGAAGPIRWNAIGQNLRPVRLATIRDGRVVAIGAAEPAPPDLSWRPCGSSSPDRSHCSSR